ncbi:MAG: CarD family transcriptional regulator [Candidatus Fimenecus sp.]
MFENGDKLVYGRIGACILNDVVKIQIDRQKITYYELYPMFGDTTRVLVPVENESLTKKIKPLLKKKEADTLLKKVSKMTDYSKLESDRRLTFEEAAESLDREMLLLLLKYFKEKQEKLTKVSKNLKQGDQTVFKEAEKLVLYEFSAIYDPDIRKTKTTIYKKLGI